MFKIKLTPQACGLPSVPFYKDGYVQLNITLKVYIYINGNYRCLKSE